MEKIIKRCIVSTTIILIIYISYMAYGIYNNQNIDYYTSLFLLILFLIPYNISCLFIYLLEKHNKIIYIVILLLFIIIYWVIELNFYDFSNYENWQYYNRQSIISHNIDFFIGKNLLELYFLLKIILVAYIVSMTIYCYNLLKKRWRKN